MQSQRLLGRPPWVMRRGAKRWRPSELRALNAFISEAEVEEAGSEAPASSATEGPLSGVRLAVKDCFSTRGIRTTCASRMLKDYVPPLTATTVQRLTDAGAVVVGKTNLDEFSMGSTTTRGAFGATVNPWGVSEALEGDGLAWRVPGGSSGGSAVAVAAGMAEVGGGGLRATVNPWGVSEALEGDGLAWRVPGGSSGGSAVAVAAGMAEVGGGGLRATVNPWGVSEALEGDGLAWRVPGGSSGGSAVAVAAGMAEVGLGSDTGGSARNPAAWCGVLGLKPTYGALSRHGLVPLVNSLDAPSLIAKDPDVLRRAFEASLGADPLDSTSLAPRALEREPWRLEGLRVGLPLEYRTAALSPEVAANWDAVAETLQEAGAKVMTVSLRHTALSILVYHVLGEAEVASNMSRYDGVRYGHRAQGHFNGSEALMLASRQESLGPVVRRRILAGNFFLLRDNYQRYVEKAMRVRRLIAEDFERAWAEVDVLLTPVASTVAPTLRDVLEDEDGYGRERSDDYFTQPVNMAGLPALAFPTGLSAASSPSSPRLPLGLQLVGPRWSELRLIRLAEKLMESHPTEQLDMDIVRRNLRFVQQPEGGKM